MNLKDSGLFRQAALVAGRWIDADETGTPVHDPATGEVIGYVPSLELDLLREGIDLAEAAQGDWAR